MFRLAVTGSNAIRSAKKMGAQSNPYKQKDRPKDWELEAHKNKISIIVDNQIHQVFLASKDLGETE